MQMPTQAQWKKAIPQLIAAIITVPIVVSCVNGIKADEAAAEAAKTFQASEEQRRGSKAWDKKRGGELFSEGLRFVEHRALEIDSKSKAIDRYKCFLTEHGKRKMKWCAFYDNSGDSKPVDVRFYEIRTVLFDESFAVYESKEGETMKLVHSTSKDMMYKTAPGFDAAEVVQNTFK